MVQKEKLLIKVWIKSFVCSTVFHESTIQDPERNYENLVVNISECGLAGE